MQAGRASRTALGAARHRAEHQACESGIIFPDPLAQAIIGNDVQLRTAAELHERRPMRAYIAARSRFAEEALAAAVTAGTGQVVILGAGLDTFAYRNPYSQVRVFEIDHPDTQQWKRDRLRQGGIAVPHAVEFVSVDFEHQSFVGELVEHEFDPSAPAFVIWMGVTIYLTKEAIAETLGALGTLAIGTEVVFDYALPRREPTDPTLRRRQAERMRRLAAIGEPWISYFDPQEMAELLRRSNLIVVDDIPTSEVVNRYLGREPQPAAGPHLVRAAVARR